MSVATSTNRSGKNSKRTMRLRKKAEATAAAERRPLSDIEPMPIGEWGSGRQVLLTPASRTSQIAKAHVLRTDAEQEAFGEFARRDLEAQLRELEALVAEAGRFATAASSAE